MLETDEICVRCDEPIATHQKCNHCGILLHIKKEEYKCRCGRQHTKISKVDPDYCEECWFELFKK